MGELKLKLSLGLETRGLACIYIYMYVRTYVFELNTQDKLKQASFLYQEMIPLLLETPTSTLQKKNEVSFKCARVAVLLNQGPSPFLHHIFMK